MSNKKLSEKLEKSRKKHIFYLFRSQLFQPIIEKLLIEIFPFKSEKFSEIESDSF
jgi:hypothetical protein